MSHNEGGHVHGELVRRVRELQEENARLRVLLGLDERAGDGHEMAWSPTLLPAANKRTSIDATAIEADQLALLWSLFGARSDVFAIRWENASTGKSGWSPATRGRWSQRRSAKTYLPLTDDVFARHLRGEVTAGIYPLLPGDSCALLACDFDGSTWALDALAYLDACHSPHAAGAPQPSPGTRRRHQHRLRWQRTTRTGSWSSSELTSPTESRSSTSKPQPNWRLRCFSPPTSAGSASRDGGSEVPSIATRRVRSSRSRPPGRHFRRSQEVALGHQPRCRAAVWRSLAAWADGGSGAPISTANSRRPRWPGSRFRLSCTRACAVFTSPR